MLKYTALFSWFFVYSYISNAEGHIFGSLEKLDLPTEQKNHVQTLKSQLWPKANQTDVMKPKLEQDIKDMLNVTSTSDILVYNKLLNNVTFLEICPQLVQTMDDLSYSLPIKTDVYNLIAEQLNKDPKKGNRTEILEQLKFLQPDVWKIFMHWIMYRMSESEKVRLETLHDLKHTSALFRKIQTAFSAPYRKECLKRIVLDLGEYVSMIKQPASLEDVRKRFPGLEKTIQDIKKYKKNKHFVHAFLPYGLKDEKEFQGLAIWLMFRIDSGEEDTLKKEYPKIYQFRVKFRDEFEKVEEIGQSMDITWQVASYYMKLYKSQ